ncbi:BrnT family toxin [Bdellovibrio bacteriovorus]|uniref:BrnT family toxin n=1 Tax=Bdellovibrio bacteriovorus TaxID=959 RepID=UPI003A7FE1DE
MKLGIEFDEGNKVKLTKHGLSIAEIERFFENQPVYTHDDSHSGDETRFIAFGSLGTRLVFVAFTIRAANGTLWMRPISARYARQKEIRKLYEKNFK